MSETLGKRRVNAEFNPAKNAIVDQIKNKTAELIDLVEKLRYEILPDNSGTGAQMEVKRGPETNRLVSLAQTDFESAAMWAVKANFTND